MSERKADVVFDDPAHYPTKDWRDKNVTEPGDLNEEIPVWQISPRMDGDGGCYYARSYKDAMAYVKDLIEGNLIETDPDKLVDEEEGEITIRLIKMTLGDYINVEGE